MMYIAIHCPVRLSCALVWMIVPVAQGWKEMDHDYECRMHGIVNKRDCQALHVVGCRALQSAINVFLMLLWKFILNQYCHLIRTYYLFGAKKRYAIHKSTCSVIYLILFESRSRIQ